MIVGCYTLDLYCDFENAEHPWNAFPKQFCGHTLGECKRAARKDGWTFHKDGNARCPKCKGNTKLHPVHELLAPTPEQP